MIRTVICIALALAVVPLSYAADSDHGLGQILVASPTTTFAGKKVSENEILKTTGALKTGSEGGAKLKLAGNDVVVEMAANSEIHIVLPPSGDPSDSIELIKGKVRVRVPKPKDGERGDSKSDKPRFLLRHRKVTMGVRGTDFLAVATDELDETELVVFTGEVAFSKEKDAKDKAPKDTQLVAAGHWSGVGGRFGEKVRPPMRLAPDALEYYEKLSRSIPNFSLQAVPTEKSPAGAQTTSPGH
ncbi:MAG: FecR domain-containing protein [Bdellovibrionales bacterium]|nr:FecR domain-containing protein [Bdellovibrionales bacterium]